jgi:hypothetical protein
MRLRLFLIVAIAVSLLGPTYGWARNEHGTLPESRVVAVIPPVVSLHSLRHLFPKKILGGCGSHRYYDSAMQKCRGPGDF